MDFLNVPAKDVQIVHHGRKFDKSAYFSVGLALA